MEIGGGEAIIKPGRLGPHPIQRRGQRSGNPQFFRGNLDQEKGVGGQPQNPIFSENCICQPEI